MVTLDQVKRGLTSYIDTEILPNLSGAKRYGVMVYMALLLDNINTTVMEAMRKPAMSMLNLIDQNGNVDIGRLHDAAFNAMNGNLQVDIPVVGRFTFSRNDVDRLCEMIRRA